MKNNICYRLLKRYDKIVSVFTDSENNDVAIVESVNGGKKYIVTYNFLTSPCNGGFFITLENAEDQVMRLRPGAIKC